jgi:glycosyltransferase involved in cell wall biosynthesis
MARFAVQPLPVELSIVVPAYNEEPVLGAVIREAVDALESVALEFEIVVVDDGSSDGTGAVLNRWAAADSRVRVVRHATNRGYADALRSGFAAARFGLVAFTDADGQFDLRDLRELLPVAVRHGMAVGYRADRRDPWLRKLYSRGYNLLARTLCGTRARDCDCALKVFRRDVLHTLWPRTKGYFVNTEILTRARQFGYPLVELPVSHRPRRGGVSKVSVREIPRVFRTLLGFWWREVVCGVKPVPVPTVVSARIPVENRSPAARAA